MRGYPQYDCLIVRINTCVNVHNGWGGAPTGVRVTRSKIRAVILRVDRRIRTSNALFRLCLIFIWYIKVTYSQILLLRLVSLSLPSTYVRLLILFNFYFFIILCMFGYWQSSCIHSISKYTRKLDPKKLIIYNSYFCFRVTLPYPEIFTEQDSLIVF